MASNITESLETLMGLDGAMAAAVVDAKSGMVLGASGSGIDIELAAAGNSEVVNAKNKIMQKLGLKGGIEDILITLTKQYHIIRPTATQEGVFFYLVLDRSRSNLALSRMAVQNVEKKLFL
jgi:predicted regulator of Ras-like GTPase activity (Roadblock/LC7/MglB family)